MTNKDLTDYSKMKFGRLTPIKNVGNKYPKWLCKCDCGNEVYLTPGQLRKRKSCGCLQREYMDGDLGRNNKKHGMSKTRLYRKYRSMINRCYYPKSSYYKRYGGRGITVCEEWKNSFENFMNWAYENGYDETKKKYEQTIDRIDNDGNYEPSNCRLISLKEQAWNKSSSRCIQDGNELISSHEFCIRHGIPDAQFAYRRVKKGLTAEEILNEWKIIKNEEGKYMTTDEACHFYNINKAMLTNWIKKGKIDFVRVSKYVFIPKGQCIDNRT